MPPPLGVWFANLPFFQTGFPVLRFGAQRLWGAIGYAVASFIGGYISSSDGGSYGGVMVMFVVVTLGTLAASAGISVGKAHTTKQNDHSPE